MNEKGKENNPISSWAGGSPQLCSQKMLAPNSSQEWATAGVAITHSWLIMGGKSGKDRCRGLWRSSPLTQTAPLRRTAPGGRRLVQTHTWTCSAVQKEPGKNQQDLVTHSSSAGWRLVTLHVSMLLGWAPMAASLLPGLWAGHRRFPGPSALEPRRCSPALTGS